jgi:hypothetical protein
LTQKKTAKAAVAIAAAYRLCRVSEGTKSNQLAAANALALIVIAAIIYGPRLVLQKSAITLLFQEAREAFPPLKGKPLDEDLTTIRETILPILIEIPYDQLQGVHSLMAILTEPGRYAADHGGSTFVCPSCLPLYDKNIADNAKTVVRVCGEAAHRARLDDYASYQAAERGAAKFLIATVDETWYANLKDADTFYTKVLAIELMAFLNTNSGGLHTVNMLTLWMNMHGYYAHADGIPQYIIMLEEAQKKAKRVGMPIANIKLVMMDSVAILAADD